MMYGGKKVGPEVPFALNSEYTLSDFLDTFALSSENLVYALATEESTGAAEGALALSLK